MDRIVVIGGGGHARALISVLKKTSWNVVGYTDPLDKGIILGVARLGADSVLPQLLRTYDDGRAAIGVGKIDTSSKRLRLQEELEAIGYEFPTIVSPTAVLNEEVTLGEGTVVLDVAAVGAGTAVGRGCILNTNCTVEHDCRVGDDVHIAPGAVVSGGVTIGKGCLIGAGVTIIQGLTICENCLIGAGAVVLRNVDSPGTYIGNPARRAKS